MHFIYPSPAHAQEVCNQLLTKYKFSRDRLPPEKRITHAQLPKFLEMLKQEVVNDDSPIWDEKFKPSPSQYLHHRKREREAVATTATIPAVAGTSAAAAASLAPSATTTIPSTSAAAAVAAAAAATSTSGVTSKKYSDQPSTSKKYKRESQSDSKYQVQQQLQQQQKAALEAVAAQQPAAGIGGNVDTDLTDEMVQEAIKQIDETKYVNNLDVVLAVNPPRDETVKAQELRGEIELHIVGNSLTRPVSKQSMLWLLGLHSVFAYQLPVMPREYISHLVFDP